MMNLAPFRYRRVLSTHGGPIRAMECGATSVMGRRMFQANAYLTEGLRPIARSNVIYGNPDGTGTATRPNVARHKAISEALERWAHHIVQRSPEAPRYGFDVDSSSNGMAAFPGLLHRQARKLALGEAAERYALASWWSGASDAVRLNEVWPGIEAWRLDNPVSQHAVVLLHGLADVGVHAYGHGSGTSVADACMRAAVELARAQYVLRRHARRPASENTPQVRSMLERRCLYFSSESGYAEFCERMAQRKWRSVVPEIVFDGEIPGPWSEYASVWRVVIKPPSEAFLDRNANFFFW